eukprot:TRINITY_DN1069_c0_g1_i1.p1 TRINITY_DN1069_c0_g1~~TRINITY_DN1069_c0_g1_i1.p1  ORF type:complete len:929 (-),score=150.96 TRINITY_DN1069_c0_g1_i1:330-3116(-)
MQDSAATPESLRVRIQTLKTKEQELRKLNVAKEEKTEKLKDLLAKKAVELEKARDEKALFTREQSHAIANANQGPQTLVVSHSNRQDDFSDPILQDPTQQEIEDFDSNSTVLHFSFQDAGFGYEFKATRFLMRVKGINLIGKKSSTAKPFEIYVYTSSVLVAFAHRLLGTKISITLGKNPPIDFDPDAFGEQNALSLYEVSRKARTIRNATLKIPNTRECHRGHILVKEAEGHSFSWSWCIIHLGMFEIRNARGRKTENLQNATFACLHTDERYAQAELTIPKKGTIHMLIPTLDLEYWEAAFDFTISLTQDSGKNEWKGVIREGSTGSIQKYLILRDGQISIYKDVQASQHQSPESSIFVKNIKSIVPEGRLLYCTEKKKRKFYFENEHICQQFYSLLENARKSFKIIDENSIKKSGYVMERLKGKNTTRFIWLILTDDRLIAYNDHMLTDQVFFEDLRLCALQSPSKETQQLDFVLTSSRQIYQLLAPDAGSFDAWTKSIRSAIHAAVNPSREATTTQGADLNILNYMRRKDFALPDSFVQIHTTLYSNMIMPPQIDLPTLLVPNMRVPYIPAESKSDMIAIYMGKSHFRVFRSNNSFISITIPAISATDNQDGQKTFGQDALEKVLNENYNKESVFSPKKKEKLGLLCEFFRHIFTTVLRLDPKGRKVVLICDYDVSIDVMHQLGEILFDRLKVSKARFCHSSEFYTKQKHPNYIALSIGRKASVSAFSHEALLKRIAYQKFGGSNLTKTLRSHIFQDNRVSGNISKLYYWAQEIKERYCVVSEEVPSGRATSFKNDQTEIQSSFKTLLVRKIHLEGLAEALFDPTKNPNQISVMRMISDGLSNLDKSIGINVIYLQGGTTRMPGFVERLQRELADHFPGKDWIVKRSPFEIGCINDIPIYVYSNDHTWTSRKGFKETRAWKKAS